MFPPPPTASDYMRLMAAMVFSSPKRKLASVAYSRINRILSMASMGASASIMFWIIRSPSSRMISTVASFMVLLSLVGCVLVMPLLFGYSVVRKVPWQTK